jgi:hypothetical protein
MNAEELKAVAGQLDATRDALDTAVYAALAPDPRPAIDICTMVGLDWGTEAKDLRSSFLRLEEQGRAQLRYGQGWARVVPDA